MAGYAYLSQVQDANAQKAFKAAFDLISTLSNRLVALEAAAIRNTAAIDANGQRVTNVGDPMRVQDAVTVAFLQAFVSAQLEAFKGRFGVDSTFSTAGTFTVVVEDGLIKSVT